MLLEMRIVTCFICWSCMRRNCITCVQSAALASGLAHPRDNACCHQDCLCLRLCVVCGWQYVV